MKVNNHNNRIPYIKPYKSVPPVEICSIELKNVPSVPTLRKFDFIPVIVTLLLSGFVCFLFFIISGSFPFYFLLFPITMLVMPLVTHWRSKSDAKKDYVKSTTQYVEYLDRVNTEWQKQNMIVAQYYHDNYPHPSTITECIKKSLSETGKKLWCVLPEHSEFLSFRIGIHNRTTPIKLQKSNDLLADRQDSIKEKITTISENNAIISSSPLVVDLKKNPFIAFRVSSIQQSINHINAALLGLFTTHAYDNINLAVICKQESEKSMSWLRWLPHIWDDQSNFRFFCADNVKTDILDRLEANVKKRHERATQISDYPKYIFVIEDKEAFFSHTLSSYFTSTDTQLGIIIVFVIEKQETIPSICSLIIDVNNNKLYEHKSNDEITFEADNIDTKTAENIARFLSNIEIMNGDKRRRFPEIVTFYDLLDNDALQQKVIHRNWSTKKAHCKGIELSVPIGIRDDGVLIHVNLKDGADGPHAIIAGMTGSGKTELLQTLILSLCINFHPEQVNFAFIDFKEGGMATQFKGIPHESGILTNKGNNVAYLANRAITMLKQEKKYRGDLLSDFGLDIDQYHKKYYSKNRGVMKPLPHLFVIIDESAEVVDQFREFMSEMVSLARIGRSMGIHLILSTQNPSRTVDSQIHDNANLKICLSVLNEEESKAILKTKDAAYIINRGRAILMAGNGKRTEEFQSAYTGAKTISNSENLGTEPIAIFSDGNIAQLVTGDNEDSSRTQLHEVLNILRNMSSIQLEHKVFSETLSDDLYLYDADDKTLNAMSECGFSTIIGKADVLECQSIQDVIVNFDTCRNLVIYGAPRSGKTTLAESILFDIIQRYPQDRLQCIIVATSTSSMSRLTGKSFISEVITEGDQEKLYRLPTFLLHETKRRLMRMKEKDVDSIVEYEKIPMIEKLPRIVVFIDSLQHYQQKVQTQLMDVFAAGSNQAGIYVVATYQNSALPRDIASYFGGQVALQIHDDLTFKYNIFYRGIIENKVGRGIYGDQLTDYVEIQAFQPSLTAENARKLGNSSSEALKHPYNINNGSIDYLDQSIKPAYSVRIHIKTVFDILDCINPTMQSLPIGVYYESLEPFTISEKTKACIFSILGDRQARDDLRLLLYDKLLAIGSVLYYGDTKNIPDMETLKKAFEAATENGSHLFVLIHYESEKFITELSNNHSSLIQLLETTYRGKASLVLVTSNRLAKFYSSINEYCINANCIVAIGGKHDAHVRFADVSTKILDIPTGEAYVSTSSTHFEKVILKCYQ